MIEQIPHIGFGTWYAPLDVTKRAVIDALNAGYKHIDCAYAYQNESAVGEAFEEYFKDHDRSDVWITTKLWNTNHRPENVAKQLEQQLRDLRIGYVDLFLIHWGVNFEHGAELFPKNPDGSMRLERGYGMMDTWKAMEALVDEKLTRFVGVSNFRPAMLNDLLSYCRIKPLVNQIEVHPQFYNTKVIQYCFSRGVGVTAYSPLGGYYNGTQMITYLEENPVLREIAANHGVSVSQVVLRWHSYRFPGYNYSFIPKSTHYERIAANLAIFGFKLDESEMQAFDAIECGRRCCDPMDFWGIPYFD